MLHTSQLRYVITAITLLAGALLLAPFVSQASTISTLTPGLDWYEEDFNTPSLVDDGYDYISKTIVVSDGLDETGYLPTTQGNILQMKSAADITATELLGPITSLDTALRPWYASLDAAFLEGNNSVKVKIINPNGDTYPGAVFTLQDGGNTLDLSMLPDDADEFYILLMFRSPGGEVSPAVNNLRVAFGNTTATEGYPLFHNEVAYDTNHAREVMDFYRSPTPNADTPVVLFVHGGGFTKGDKDAIWGKPIFKELLANGVSVATINYRFLGMTHFQPVMESGGRAVQYLRHFASTFGLDNTKIAAMGKSAGGYMMSWVSTYPDLADPAHTNPVYHESSKVNAVLGYDTPLAFDRDEIETYVGCDTSTWNKIINFYGLELIIQLPERIIDWTEYYARAITQQQVVDARVHTWVDSTDAPIRLVYYGELNPELE